MLLLEWAAVLYFDLPPAEGARRVTDTTIHHFRLRKQNGWRQSWTTKRFATVTIWVSSGSVALHVTPGSNQTKLNQNFKSEDFEAKFEEKKCRFPSERTDVVMAPKTDQLLVVVSILEGESLRL